jgi:SAM-dependent methyltransferase
MRLTVETYGAAERAALVQTPNRIIECCKPITFSEVGYPTQISDDRALIRYVEVMHEVRLPQIAEHLGDLTKEEGALIESVATTVGEMSDRLYGVKRIPRESLLDALHICRHIKYLYPDQKPSVLEVGPGSGYLGALLLLLDHEYASTDITQAFYLYQNHLLHEFTGGRFLELAIADQTPLNPKAFHLPWWVFYLPDGNPPVSAQVITCNHALCEMHPHARAYVLKIASKQLQQRRDGALVFFSFGSPILHPVRDVIRSAFNVGLRVAHHDDRITVMVGENHPAADQCFHLTRAEQVTDDFHLPIFVNEKGLINRAIAAGRKMTAEHGTIGLEQVDAILSGALGTKRGKTDDQRFLDFIA